MNCNEIDKLLTSYLLGDLDDEQVKAVREHLSECSGCRALAEDIEPTLDLLRDALAATNQAHEHLTPKQHNKIFKADSSPGIFRNRKRPVRMILSWAAMLVICLGLTGLTYRVVDKSISYSRRRTAQSNLHEVWKIISAWGLDPTDTWRSTFPQNGLEPVAEEGELPEELLVNHETGIPIEFFRGRTDVDGDKPVLASHGKDGTCLVYVNGQTKWFPHGEEIPELEEARAGRGNTFVKLPLQSGQDQYAMTEGPSLEDLQRKVKDSGEVAFFIRAESAEKKAPRDYKRAKKAPAPPAPAAETAQAQPETTLSYGLTGKAERSVHDDHDDVYPTPLRDDLAETSRERVAGMAGDDVPDDADELGAGKDIDLNTGATSRGYEVALKKNTIANALTTEPGKSKPETKSGIRFYAPDLDDSCLVEEEIEKETQLQHDANPCLTTTTSGGRLDIASSDSPATLPPPPRKSKRDADGDGYFGGLETGKNQEIELERQSESKKLEEKSEKTRDKLAVSKPASSTESLERNVQKPRVKADHLDRSRVVADEPAKPASREPAAAKPTSRASETKEMDRLEKSKRHEKSFFQTTMVNPFVTTADDPLSTFSIDVDTASYTLARNYMLRGLLPPPGAVRPEEFINFFDYAYPGPDTKAFAVHVDAAPSPFRHGLHILRVGVKGKTIGRDQAHGVTLTILVDTSGSMETPDRLDLVKKSLRLLVDRLNKNDSIAIIQCNTHARLILDFTPASKQNTILKAINSLRSSGSTNIEEGMKVAYQAASRGFRAGTSNRVLLLSDGMANLGSDSGENILASVRTHRDTGIFCSVFGFGMGSYNDVMLETLAEKGNGNYTFIDSIDEAERLFVDNLSATLNTIASDVKIQVELNPERVKRYRLIGYERRSIPDKDFRNDKVDAGEVGSGQSATAIYEIQLRGDRNARIGVVRVRYRDTEDGTIEEVNCPIEPEAVSDDFVSADANLRLAATVAEFSEKLRGSPFASNTAYPDIASALRPIALKRSMDKRLMELLRFVETARDMSRSED